MAAWLEQFEAFLYNFGSRGPNEWETRSNSWETHPELALSAIDRMRISPAEMAPGLQFEARAAERATVSAILLAMVEGDAETHGQLSAAIASSAAWLPGRERTKTNNIRFIHELRVALRELGRRMVAAGGFDEVEDFAMVQEDEWPALLAAPTSMLDTVRQRRAEYDDLLTRANRRSFLTVTLSLRRRGGSRVKTYPTSSLSATRCRGSLAAPARPRGVPVSFSTATIRSPWSQATY